MTQTDVIYVEFRLWRKWIWASIFMFCLSYRQLLPIHPIPKVMRKKKLLQTAISPNPGLSLPWTLPSGSLAGVEPIFLILIKVLPAPPRAVGCCWDASSVDSLLQTKSTLWFFSSLGSSYHRPHLVNREGAAGHDHFLPCPNIHQCLEPQ